MPFAARMIVVLHAPDIQKHVILNGAAKFTVVDACFMRLSCFS